MKPPFAKEFTCHSTLAKYAFSNWLNQAVIWMCMFSKFGDYKRNWNRGGTSWENLLEDERTLKILIAVFTKLAGKTYKSDIFSMLSVREYPSVCERKSAKLNFYIMNILSIFTFEQFPHANIYHNLDRVIIM